MGEDQVFWAESKKGSFIVQSAYHAISSHGHNKEDQIWSLAWNWQGPHCIRIFL